MMLHTTITKEEVGCLSPKKALKREKEDWVCSYIALSKFNLLEGELVPIKFFNKLKICIAHKASPRERVVESLITNQ
jgi:hypothetical protein